MRRSLSRSSCSRRRFSSRRRRCSISSRSKRSSRSNASVSRRSISSSSSALKSDSICCRRSSNRISLALRIAPCMPETLSVISAMRIRRSRRMPERNLDSSSKRSLARVTDSMLEEAARACCARSAASSSIPPASLLSGDLLSLTGSHPQVVAHFRVFESEGSESADKSGLGRLSESPG